MKLFSLAIAILICATLAQAEPIGPNCGTCQGSIYTLTGSFVSSNPANNTQTWRITLTIDTSSYNGGGTAISAVAIKVSSSVVGSSLFAAPGGLADWILVPGGLNHAGCNGSGSGFDCAGWIGQGPGITLIQGPFFSWTFDQTIANGSLFTGPLQASIKAEYVNGQGTQVGALVSEDITLQNDVPEPELLILLGIGFFAVVGFSRWTRFI